VTRDKHISIVKAALVRGIPAGWSPEKLAEGIVNRVELAIEMEIEDAGSGLYEQPGDKNPDLDKSGFLKIEGGKGDKKLLDPLPVPPAKEGSSLIIDPNSLSSAPLISDKRPVKAAPLRMSSNDHSSDRGLVRFWSQDQLKEYLYQNTEPTIKVMAVGRKEPIDLTRNIEVLYGIDLVKLSYSLGITNYPSPSDINLDGSTPQAMSVDVPIFVNFSTFDKEQDISGKMSVIYSQAGLVYGPRPEKIFSVTPMRSGSISYQVSDPHEDADLSPGFGLGTLE
jgi:hypothetical protein